MSPAAAVALGLAAAEAVRRWLPDRSERVGAVLALALWQPPLVLLGAVAAAAARLRARRVGAGDEEARRAADLSLLPELVLLGLGGGLTLAAALRAAAGELPVVGPDLDAVLRRSRRSGLETALAAAEGPARPLLVATARAAATGAPLAAAVQAHADAVRREERARRLAAARRLPVRLLVPVALLILPGFVLLTIGPAVIGALDRLAF